MQFAWAVGDWPLTDDGRINDAENLPDIKRRKSNRIAIMLLICDGEYLTRKVVQKLMRLFIHILLNLVCNYPQLCRKHGSASTARGATELRGEQ